MSEMKTDELIEEVKKRLDACTIDCDGPHIVVLDRGWIFQGNLRRLENDEFYLTDVVNIRKWSQNGFGGLTHGAVSAGATLDETRPIRFHNNAVIFISPVIEDWRIS